MTLEQRAAAYAAAFPTRPPLQLVQEGGQPVIYGHFLIGQDYRNKTTFYGAYPNGLLQRIAALFPDAVGAQTLHAFSGSLPPGDYTRLDVNPDNRPDVIGDVCDVARLFHKQGRFKLVIADPPYSSEDAKRYGTPMINRGRGGPDHGGALDESPCAPLLWPKPLARRSRTNSSAAMVARALALEMTQFGASDLATAALLREGAASLVEGHDASWASRIRSKDFPSVKP